MNKIRGLILVALLAALAHPAWAKRLHPEAWYQEQWCAGRGVMEHVLEDGTRVDCLTETMAVEVDFAGKWYKGVTQALWYAMHTDRRAVLLLIIEQPADVKYYYRADKLVRRYDLPVDIILTGAGL